MSKITVQIGFYLQNQHYAQMQAFLPRAEALRIPQLKVDQRPQPKPADIKPHRGPGRAPKNQVNKSQKSSSKKQPSQDQMIEQEEQNMNEMENEPEQQVEEDQAMIDEEQIDESKIDSEKQEENLMRYLEEQDDSEDDDIDDDDDLSSISRSISAPRNNLKTKRQKGEHQGLLELPDRRPRKDKKLDEATQMIRRQEKQRKRKQYIKKQVQAQQKATLDKILNETGRKLKQREQKENEDEKKKQDKRQNTLGDVQKIIKIQNKNGSMIFLHKTTLFPEAMTRAPQVKIKPECNKCGSQEGRYRIKNSNNYACSLNCYKLLV